MNKYSCVAQNKWIGYCIQLNPFLGREPCFCAWRNARTKNMAGMCYINTTTHASEATVLRFTEASCSATEGSEGQQCFHVFRATTNSYALAWHGKTTYSCKSFNPMKYIYRARELCTLYNELLLPLNSHFETIPKF